MSTGKLSSDLGRNSFVIAAVFFAIAIGLAYVAWSWFGPKAAAQLPSSVGFNPNSNAVATNESEHYQTILKQYNESNSEEAASKGATYVSTISTRETPVVDPLPPEREPTPPPSSSTVNTATEYRDASQLQYDQQMAQQMAEAEKQRQEKMMKQVEVLLLGWGGTKHAQSSVIEGYGTDASVVVKTSIPSGDSSSSSSATVSSNASAVPVTKILPDYFRIAGLLETNIDTDENSDVVAFVPSGQYKDLRLYATGYKRINETVDITFDAMVWNGKTYKVKAKAVDKDSLRTSLSGEVNNRYFQRVVIPALAAGIGKTGQLFEQANSQNVITPQGGVIQSRPSTPDMTSVLGSVVGGAGEQAGKVLAQDAAKIPPKQVLIPSMTTIAIQFIGPVLSSDELAPGAVLETPTDLDEATVKRSASPL